MFITDPLMKKKKFFYSQNLTEVENSCEKKVYEDHKNGELLTTRDTLLIIPKEKMKEQIEIDREILRNNKKPKEFVEFSYLNYIKDGLDKKKKFNKINPNKTSTLNLLYLIEEKSLFNNLKVIEILKNRTDLFESALKFISSRPIKDELYYWVPGKKVTNIFTLIKQIISDFGLKYKKYLIRELTINRSANNSDQNNVVKYLMEKEDKLLVEEMEGMYKDLEIFKGKFVTRAFWVQEEEIVDERKEEFVVKNKNLLPFSETFDISANLQAFLLDDCSYVDFTVDGERKVLSYKEFKRLYL